MYKERKSPWVKERKFSRGSTYWTEEAEKEKKIREEEKLEEQEEDDYLICDVSCNDIYSCF